MSLNDFMYNFFKKFQDKADKIDVNLTGSNFEQTTAQPKPSKGVMVGGNDGANFYPLTVISGALGDGSAAAGPAYVAAFNAAYNGTNWDRWRNNTKGTLLASATRTATVISPAQINYNAKGVLVLLRVTAASGTGGLTLYIRCLDTSGNGYGLNSASTAITTTGTFKYILYPGSAVTNVNAAQIVATALPRDWDVSVAHGDGSSYTYSVDYSLIL